MAYSFNIYKPLSDRILKSMWKKSIFILDTNIILNLYRYPVSAREALLKLLESLKDQIWIPHQVAEEFYKNRLEVIYDQIDAYDTMCKLLDKNFEIFEKEINNIALRHPYIDTILIKHEVKKTIENEKNKIRKSKKEHPHWSNTDKMLRSLEKIIKSKIGKPYKKDELNKLYIEAEERYRSKIPPGYMDATTKEFPDKYKDYVIWKQILDKVKEIKKSVILISDDQKEDWMLEINGKKVCPRFELRKELFEETGQQFHIYSGTRFLEVANKFSKIQLNQKTKRDIQQILDATTKIGIEIQKNLNEAISNIATSNVNIVNELTDKVTQSLQTRGLNQPIKEKSVNEPKVIKVKKK